MHFEREVCLYNHVMWRSDVPVVSDYDHQVRREVIKSSVDAYEQSQSVKHTQEQRKERRRQRRDRQLQ